MNKRSRSSMLRHRIFLRLNQHMVRNEKRIFLTVTVAKKLIYISVC